MKRSSMFLNSPPFVTAVCLDENMLEESYRSLLNRYCVGKTRSVL